jgi:hypothetical protein
VQQGLLSLFISYVTRVKCCKRQLLLQAQLDNGWLCVTDGKPPVCTSSSAGASQLGAGAAVLLSHGIMQVWGAPLQPAAPGGRRCVHYKQAQLASCIALSVYSVPATSALNAPHVFAVLCHGYSQSGCALLCSPVLLETAASHSPCLERHTANHF